MTPWGILDTIERILNEYPKIMQLVNGIVLINVLALINIGLTIILLAMIGN